MKLNVIVPVYNEEKVIERFLDALFPILDFSNLDYEVIIVNDGSTDQTLKKIHAYNHKNLRVVNLISNSGHMAALEAGLSQANAHLVVTMDADLQHPVELIPEMIHMQRAFDCDVVIGQRIRGNEESWHRRVMAGIFYWSMSKVSRITILRDAGDFRLMTMQVVRTLNELPETQKVFRFLINSLGFRVKMLPFRSPKRAAGESKYRFRDLFKLALTSLIGFSTFPLSAIFFGGILIFLISIGYSLFLIGQYMTDAIVPGWTSVMVTILVLSAIQVVSLGVIGRYISQILAEIRNRPSYLVRDVLSFPNEEKKV
jgi:glycosyltransferase involved in cell wall biosynthesis